MTSRRELSVTTVGAIGELLRGVTYRKADARSTPAPEHVPLLRANNIDGELRFDDLVYVPSRYVSPQQILRPGDIVIAASSGSRRVVGKAAALKRAWAGSFGAFCYVLRPGPHIDPAYIAYFMQSNEYRTRVSELAAGVSINNLRREHITDLNLPLPDREEQREIVRQLDQTWSRLDAANAPLARVPRGVGRFRSAILHSAYTGALIAGVDNSQWARATLPELTQDGVFRDGDWVETKDQDPSGDTRLIQLADVGDGRFLDRSNRFLTSEKASQLRATRLQAGDVLVARMPDPLGRACLYPGDPMPAITAVDVCIVRPPSGGVLNRWLMWTLNSPQLRRAVAQMQSGSTRKRISRKNLGTISLPVPPADLQRRIADEVEHQLSIVESLDVAARLATTKLAAIKTGVLRRELSL